MLAWPALIKAGGSLKCCLSNKRSVVVHSFVLDPALMAVDTRYFRENYLTGVQCISKKKYYKIKENIIKTVYFIPLC